jgi:hypothetical protein
MATVTTAMEAWGKSWSTAEGRADWVDPDPDVMAPLPELKARGAHSALDLGRGVGRHSLYLVERGLAVEAIDGGAAGLAVMREIARARAHHWVCDKERPTRRLRVALPETAAAPQTGFLALAYHYRVAATGEI